MKKEKITAIVMGSGNVATQLALAFKKSGVVFLGVYSRNKKNAAALARKLNCKAAASPKELDPSAGFCILSVSDDAIETLAHKTRFARTIVLHTSGSVSLEKLKKMAHETGVLYPLQTITKNKTVSFHSVPLLTEGSSKATLQKINTFASRISKNVIPVDSSQRLTVHLAAVFANNFTHHIFSIAENILKKEKIDHHVLFPLIEQTLQNAKQGNLQERQTGPAARNDKTTLKKHLDLLRSNKNYRKIYKLLTKSIQQSSNERF